MNDAVRRTLRTTFQGGAAAVVLEAILKTLEAFNVPITPEQHSAVLVLLTSIATLVQNLLEDNTSLPAVLKSPPDPNQPDEGHFQ